MPSDVACPRQPSSTVGDDVHDEIAGHARQVDWCFALIDDEDGEVAVCLRVNRPEGVREQRGPVTGADSDRHSRPVPEGGGHQARC